MNNDLKEGINNMQYHIDRLSSKILLIFDSDYLRRDHIKKMDKVEIIDEICITTYELCYTNKLSGLRFKAFYFMK